MQSESQSKTGIYLILSFLWIISIITVGILGFLYGREFTAISNVTSKKNTDTKNNDNSIYPINTAQLEQEIKTNALTPTINPSICSKNGFAQKWEYLIPYVVKQSDSLQSIAQEQLKDSTRGDEILKINGVGSLIVGSTIYLPPSSITKSSGNLKQLYGKLVDKNVTAWHINFSSDPNGQGILIPSYLFGNVVNADSFKLGDCLSIFLDDGYKIYTIAKQ